MIFIGVGSSIGDAQKTFKQAQLFLEKKGIKIIKQSAALKNPAQGGVAQNEFTNAVWQIEFLETPWENINWILLSQTRRFYLKAKKLLKILHQCEKNLGRVPAARWDDRTLDLDILMFHSLIRHKKKLTIPHPEIPKRSFVLLPWSEIVDEDFSIPKFGSLTTLAQNLKTIS